MADNSVIINPDGPAPQPAPPPAEPAHEQPRTKVTSADLRGDLSLILKVLHGIGDFLPSGPKATLADFLYILELVEAQGWAFDVLAEVINRFRGTRANPDQFRQAVFEALVVTGEQAMTKKRPPGQGEVGQR